MDRAALAALAVVAAAAAAAVMVGGPSPSEPDDGGVHRHASLFVAVNGTRVSLPPRYMERRHAAHFHADDGVLHVHARGVTVAETLRSLNVTVNASCIRFGLEGRQYCGGVTAVLNDGTVPVETLLAREVRQGDTITFFHGDGPVPDHLRDRRLPERYRPGADGRHI